jgi:acetyl esterase/lipase
MIFSDRRRLAAFALILSLPGCSPPGMLNTLDRLTPGAGGSRVGSDITFGSHGQQLDVWRAGGKAPTRAPVMVFFYGGGWVKGTRQDYGFAARAFASRGFVVVVPDYRKVPDVRFPDFVEDGAQAIRWAHDHIAEFGGDPEKIAIAGHSAGGHTVAMLALDPRFLEAQKLPRDTIKAAVGLSGPYDFYPFTGRAIDAMANWPKPQDTQPIHFARADAPPMLLVTGTTDTTVRPRNARNLAAALKAVGAPVEEKEYLGQGHESIVMALSLPFRGKAPVLDDSVAFVNRALEKPLPTR